MPRIHNYQVQTVWTGNKGLGTSGYQTYERSHEIQVEGKPKIFASSDPKFRGDATRYNPEELFLASIATCHIFIARSLNFPVLSRCTIIVDSLDDQN